MEGLPKSQMKDVLFVVMDRLTKYVHFIPLSHAYISTKVASLYMQFAFKLHGMLCTIVSDRDPIFTSCFWTKLIRLQGVALAMSSSYHPQTNGQIKVVNKSLEHYLRAFATDKLPAWVKWLPLAEFWFNMNFHTSVKLTPFKALYGYHPPRVLDYVAGTTEVGIVDLMLKNRQQRLTLLKHNLYVPLCSSRKNEVVC